MKRERVFSVLLVLSLVSLLLISAAPASSTTYFASLNGANEVPPVDTDAIGRFAAQVNSSETKMRVNLVVGRIDDVFAAHIHCGVPGQNGPIGVTLYMGDPISFGGVGTLASAVISAPNAGNACGWETVADVAAAMASGNAYTNVHTLAVPSGEIRGNIQ